MFVRLQGYQTAREIKEFENSFYFEVAEEGHCNTCRSRIDRIEATAFEKGLKISRKYLHDRYPSDGKTLWVGLEKTKPEMSEEEIKTMFREQLDLPII